MPALAGIVNFSDLTGMVGRAGIEAAHPLICLPFAIARSPIGAGKKLEGKRGEGEPAYYLPSVAQGQVYDLVLEFAWQAGAPNEHQVVYNCMDVHATRELHNSRDMPALGQMGTEVYRHRGSIVGDQQAALNFYPGEDL